MPNTLKAPPILPIPLLRFAAAGLIFSAACAALAVVAERVLGNSEWIEFPSGGEFGRLVFVACISITGGIAALWAALYVSCLPYLYYRHWRGRLSEKASRRDAAAAQVRADELAEKAEYDAYRFAQNRALSRRDQEIAQAALNARLAEVERQVLAAYAQHAVSADFFGNVSETEQLKAFGARLGSLPINQIGVLRHSRHGTIIKLVSYASLPVVDVLHFVPPQHPQGAHRDPLMGPSYNPFIKINYPLPQQTLRQRFRNKFRSLRQP